MTTIDRATLKTKRREAVVAVQAARARYEAFNGEMPLYEVAPGIHTAIPAWVKAVEDVWATEMALDAIDAQLYGD